MSADTLRRAAELIREDWPLSPFCPDDCNCEDDLDDYHHGATYNRAVADWLDNVAAPFDQMWEADEDGILWGYDLDGDSLRFDESQDSLALAVARAYLGEGSA